MQLFLDVIDMGVNMPAFRPKNLAICLIALMSAPAFAQSDEEMPSVTLDKIVVTAEAQVKQSLGVSKINQTDLERTPV